MLLGKRAASQAEANSEKERQCKRKRTARGVIPRLREDLANWEKNQKTVKKRKVNRAIKHENHKFKM